MATFNFPPFQQVLQRQPVLVCAAHHFGDAHERGAICWGRLPTLQDHFNIAVRAEDTAVAEDDAVASFNQRSDHLVYVRVDWAIDDLFLVDIAYVTNVCKWHWAIGILTRRRGTSDFESTTD